MTLPLPTTMRAAVMYRPGAIHIEDRPVPVPEPGDVLVRVLACGVCGSDVHYFRHGRIGNFVVERPIVLGHEASGVIVGVGAHVDEARIGERVSIEPQRPSGMSQAVLAGAYNLDPGMKFFATPPIDGAFCEYVTIPSPFAWRVPDTVSDVSAALFEPLSVAIAAARRADLRAGSSVLVTGAGPIGLLCVQVARASGASRIVVSDIAADRLDVARRFGATETLDARFPFTSHLEPVDVLFEASGAAPALDAGLRSLAPQGRAVLIGMGAEEVELPIGVIQHRELAVFGLFRYANTWPAAIAMAAKGQVDLDGLVTATYPLDATQTALETANVPGSVKTMVRIDS